MCITTNLHDIRPTPLGANNMQEYAPSVSSTTTKSLAVPLCFHSVNVAALQWLPLSSRGFKHFKGGGSKEQSKHLYAKSQIYRKTAFKVHYSFLSSQMLWVMGKNTIFMATDELSE